MLEFSVDDLPTLERTPQSPQRLCDQVWRVLSHSVVARVKVESCNRETGEYRVVLQGTLESVPPDFTIGS